MWCTPTKQGTSCTGLYFEIWTNEVGIGLKNSSDNFDIFFTYPSILSIFHVISDSFSNIFPQKILHFLQPDKIKLPEKLLTVLFTTGHISKSRSINLILELKLTVCSLQWYQKLILPKMLHVPCFVGVHHISNISIGQSFNGKAI